MGKRASSTRPSETPQDLAIQELIQRRYQKPTGSHKRRASSASQRAKSDSAMDRTPSKSSLENKERAYVAASRRTDRSLEDRIKSAHQASDVHFERTGKRYRITRENVEKGLWYDEIDDLPRHRLAEYTMDNQKRRHYQEVNEQFARVYGRIVPQYHAPHQVHYSQAYLQYAEPQLPMPVMPGQQHLSGYQLPPPPISYTAEEPLPMEFMQYPYGANGPTNQYTSRRSISPASSGSAASRKPATSVSPVSNGTPSNPTSPESEIDSSAAEIMASASRHNSFDQLATSNSPMLAHDMFANFTTSAPGNTLLAGAIDPELHSPPTDYFADLSFEDMAAAGYPPLDIFNFQPPARMVDATEEGSPAAVTAPENSWEDLLNTTEYDEVSLAQGAQGWAHQG
ncbi:hypothetical protein QBC40DRAFT_219040 [Triangularia verruculosa]|uniref:Uncharacterized protein n=1 Tax=Triangularia verruculosa TaxID=2587418 RepID=A0AAN6XNF1_9PEZI|nr:hypothetical protein QBC40DRAFT_219040 [Triangularia verruculosa]